MVTQQQGIVHVITIYEALLARLHYADVRFKEERAPCPS